MGGGRARLLSVTPSSLRRVPHRGCFELPQPSCTALPAVPRHPGPGPVFVRRRGARPLPASPVGVGGVTSAGRGSGWRGSARSTHHSLARVRRVRGIRSPGGCRDAGRRLRGAGRLPRPLEWSRPPWAVLCGSGGPLVAQQEVGWPVGSVAYVLRRIYIRHYGPTRIRRAYTVTMNTPHRVARGECCI